MQIYVCKRSNKYTLKHPFQIKTIFKNSKKNCASFLTVSGSKGVTEIK